MFGISAALTTPFANDGSVDFARLNNHIKTVLSEGCTSVTLFGTTGEGPSVDGEMRMQTLRAVIDADIAPAKVVLTLHGAAAPDIINQAKAALELGVKQFLLPPPCYFGGPPDAGLFAWFSEILMTFDETEARFILYHIPQVIGVDLPVDVIAKLKLAYPNSVYGVKDSSGSLDNAHALLKLADLEILIGDERLLASCAKLGASGAISGVANLIPARLMQILNSGIDDPGINSFVDTLVQFPVTPAIKSLVAHKYSDPKWRKTRGPLVDTSDNGYATLVKAFDAFKAST